MKTKLLILAILLPLILIACSDDDKPTSSSKPSFESFSPNSGSVGTPVVITGKNFPSNKADIAVKFNGTLAVVDSVTFGSSDNSKIYLRVPVGASTGKISITISGTIYQFAEDFTVVSSNVSLLPLDEGNYWVYSKLQLDSNNATINANPGRDSLIAAGIVSILGKSANSQAMFSKVDLSTNYTKGSDQYYYEENSVIYTHSNWFDELMNFGSGGLALPFSIDEQWLKLVDPNASEWMIYTRNFNNETLSFGTLTGTLTLMGINLGTSTAQVSGKSYPNTRQINVKFNFVGNAITALGTIPLNLERVLSVWYAPAIGKIKVKMNTMRFVIPGLMDQWIPGYEQNLTDYRLK